MQLPEMTEQDRALEILSDGKWHNANEFYADYQPNFRSRISELRKEHPGRFQDRRRKGAKGKDWRDTSHDEEIRARIGGWLVESLERAGTEACAATVDSALEAEFRNAIDPFHYTEEG